MRPKCVRMTRCLRRVCVRVTVCVTPTQPRYELMTLTGFGAEVEAQVRLERQNGNREVLLREVEKARERGIQSKR